MAAGGSSFDFREVYQLADDLGDAPAQARQLIGRAIVAVGARIVSDAQAAAPVDTGFHKGEIKALTDTPGQLTIVAGAPYAGYLEFGTVHMAPRPHMMPAVDRNLPMLEAVINQIAPL